MSVENMTDYSRHKSQEADPQEVRIKGLLKEHFEKGGGLEMLERAKALEEEYLREVVADLSDPRSVHDKTQALLNSLAEAMNSRIVEGKSHLDRFPKGTPALAVVNHFSGYKLAPIEQEAVGVKIPEIEEIYLPPLFYSSIYPVAQEMGDTLHEAHFELPHPLLEIQEAAGTIIVPTSGEGVFDRVLERTRTHLDTHPHSLTVIFPEGGSSGKRNNGGPFDLDKFHTGTFRIAERLGVPIVPVAQYFNPEQGFELGILEPFTPVHDGSNEYFTQVADRTRQGMQEWINARSSL
jgi:hypothetical protein